MTYILPLAIVASLLVRRFAYPAEERRAQDYLSVVAASAVIGFVVTVVLLVAVS